jgi:hypothetical protein
MATIGGAPLMDVRGRAISPTLFCMFRRARFRFAAQRTPVSVLYFQGTCCSAAGNHECKLCLTAGVQFKSIPGDCEIPLFFTMSRL